MATESLQRTAEADSLICFCRSQITAAAIWIRTSLLSISLGSSPRTDTSSSAPPAIMTLLECQANCSEIFFNPNHSFEVLVDGGVRRGSDILKCLCLGATAVGLGRHFLYAANYGQEGVEHLIDILKSELETAMALAGIRSIEECQPGFVSTLDLDHLVSRGEGHPYATGMRRRERERARL